MELKDLRIKQGFLFHLYNWLVPLLIPSLTLFFIGLYNQEKLLDISLDLIVQMSFFNVIILSANIGLLVNDKKKDALKDIYTGLSILVTIISGMIFAVTIAISYSKEIFVQTIEIIFILSLVLVYSSILLLSKNERAPFSNKDSVVKLSKDREKVNKDQVNSIIGGTDD